MDDRCENCDRDGCQEAKHSTWAAFIACYCDPDMADPCPHQRAIHAAVSDCYTHAVNWRDRALAVEADLAALRESARWVPVGERLPDEGKDVLAFTLDNNVKSLWFERQRFETDEGSRIHHDYVTHWRPMPAPPEQQTVPEVPNV